MKKRISLLMLLSVIWFSSQISGEQVKKQNLLFTRFQSLISQHDSFLQSQDKLFDQIGKTFFSDFAFTGFNTTKQFFVNLNRTHQNGFYGQFMMTHMQMKIINGKEYAVHYTYRSDGKNVKMTKYTNNAGKILKADYTYDLKKKLLETKEYNSDKLLNQKRYKI